MTALYEKYLAALQRLDRLPAQVAEDAHQLEQHTSEEAEAARAEERDTKKAAQRLREQTQHEVDRARKAAGRVGLDDYLPPRVPSAQARSHGDPDALHAAVDRVEQRVGDLERARRLATQQAHAQAEEAKRRERERQRDEERARLAEARRRRRRRILLGIGAIAALILLLILGQLNASGVVAASTTLVLPFFGPLRAVTLLGGPAERTSRPRTEWTPNRSEMVCQMSNS